MEPSGHEATEKAVLVRDGFHVAGFLVPFLWFAFHRMWRETLVTTLSLLALSLAASYLGFGTMVGWLTLLIGIYVGLEGAALRVEAMKRADWTEWGVIEAGNRSEAELRYLVARETAAVSEGAQIIAPWNRTSPRATHSGPMLGLFSYPEAK